MKYYEVNFIISNAATNGDKPDDSQMATARDIVAALAGEAGFESFEDTDNGINGYVQAELYDKDLLESMLETFPMPDLHVEYTVAEAEDKDWNACWEEEGYEPIVIENRCVIHDMHHPVPQDLHPEIDIVIDARQAFGTGTHETTQMVASALMNTDLKGKRVLDCGCGTGILSLVAAKCGAAQILAYDIDEWSVENTKHNCKLNEVDNVDALLGDVNVLSHVSGVFDVVVANINRNILLADMPHYKDVMSVDSILILSGFYVEDGMKIAEEAGLFGMRLIKTASINNWCMLAFLIDNNSNHTL